MKKINVLHFRNCRGINTLTGPETYLLDLLSGINADIFNVVIACIIDPKNQRQLFIEELQKRKIHFELIKIKNKLDIKDFFLVSKMIKRYNIDFIHTHDSRSDVIGVLVSKMNRIAMISFAHGWLNWTSSLSKERLYAYLEALAVSLSDGIVVASNDMQQDLLIKGIPKRKIFHIPYGIDTRKFNINTEGSYFREEFDIPIDIPLIGTVGRIHPWKGHRYFLEAAKIVSGKYTEAMFLIVGDAAFDRHRKYKQELLELVQAMNIKEKVIFTGSRSDVTQIMKSMDLFVLPSLREPFGIVILEAQACGKPVIATSVGGIPEVIKDGDTGILVKPKDSDGLADAIITLLGDREKMRKMGLSGRERVEALFSTDRMVKETEELYRAIWKNSK
ncbi:MAG: glycosyltransferase family 4 protein [Candidatus Scalinduaceae bacterium]